MNCRERASDNQSIHPSMAKSLISSPSSFVGTPFPSLYRHGRLSPRTKLISTRVKFSFNGLPPISSFDAVSIDFAAIATRAESLMYTLADAAVAVDPAASASGESAATTVQKSGDGSVLYPMLWKLF